MKPIHDMEAFLGQFSNDEFVEMRVTRAAAETFEKVVEAALESSVGVSVEGTQELLGDRYEHMMADMRSITLMQATGLVAEFLLDGIHGGEAGDGRNG